MTKRTSDGGSHGGGGHGGSSGRWLVSYADFVTLLFVVFVVLFAMAKVDGEKYGQLKASLQGTMGIQPLPTGGNPVHAAPVKPGRDPNSTPGAPAPAEPDVTMPAPPLPSVVMPDEPVAEPGSVAEPEPEPEPEPTPAPASKPVEPPPKPVDPFASMANGFKAALAARAGQVDVVLQDRGVVVSVLTSVLFEPGQAELKPGAGQILDEIASQLAGGTESIVVEGAPDASDTQAPWDLASRRASAVVGYLVDTQGHSPARFSVIGYGKGAGVDGIVNVVVLRRR